jgi:ribosomal protein L31
MKADIHPAYREVVFADSSSDFKFLTRSTMSSSETIQEIQPIIFSYSYVKKAVLKRAAFFCSYGGNTAEISH